MIASGIHLGLDETEYRNDPAISVSDLKPMLISPRHFWEKKFGKRRRTPPTPAQMLGTLVHMALLEPDKFTKRVQTLPEDAPKRPTKAQQEAAKPSQSTLEAIQYWKLWEERNPQAQIVDQEMMDQVCGMRDSVMANKGAAEYFSNCETEVSVFNTVRLRNTVVRVKGRIDCVPNVAKIVDLKTVGSGGARRDEFSKSMWDWRYDLQAAYYLDLHNHLFDEWDLDKKKNDFVFVAVEKEAPYAVCLHRVSARVLERGRRDYLALLDRVAECQTLNEWPGYSDEEAEIDLPQWAEKKNPSP